MKCLKVLSAPDKDGNSGSLVLNSNTCYFVPCNRKMKLPSDMVVKPACVQAWTRNYVWMQRWDVVNFTKGYLLLLYSNYHFASMAWRCGRFVSNRYIDIRDHFGGFKVVQLVHSMFCSPDGSISVQAYEFFGYDWVKPSSRFVVKDWYLTNIALVLVTSAISASTITANVT